MVKNIIRKNYTELDRRYQINKNNLDYMNTMYTNYVDKIKTIEDDTILSSNTYYNKAYNDMKNRSDFSNAQYQTKERIIQLNNEEARRKSNKIMVMKGAFSSFFIGLFGYVLRNANVIGDGTYIAMLLLSVGTFFSFSFVFNPYTFKKISTYVKKEITEQGDKLNRAAIQWVDDNCDCSKNQK